MLSKSVQRVSSKTIRLTKRFNTYQTGSEGATAASGSFGQKEKAIENQWARSHVSLSKGKKKCGEMFEIVSKHCYLHRMLIRLSFSAKPYPSKRRILLLLRKISKLWKRSTNPIKNVIVSRR